MEWWQVLGLVLGSSVLVSLVNLLSKRLERKDTVEDRKNDAAEQIEELRAETSEQFMQVDNRFKTVETKMDKMSDKLDSNARSNSAQLFNTINHLGNKYIKSGNTIDPEDLKGLIALWVAYQEQVGDASKLVDGQRDTYEYLCRVMDEVDRLRLKPRDY